MLVMRPSQKGMMTAALAMRSEWVKPMGTRMPCTSR